jgi:hypothetical protein
MGVRTSLLVDDDDARAELSGYRGTRRRGGITGSQRHPLHLVVRDRCWTSTHGIPHAAGTPARKDLEA